jgi:hypothetical protein
MSLKAWPWRLLLLGFVGLMLLTLLLLILLALLLPLLLVEVTIRRRPTCTEGTHVTRVQ